MNLDKVIENDIEYDIYNNKIQEIKEYLNVFGPKTFWEIERAVGASERRTVRLLKEMENDNIIKFDKLSSCFYLDKLNMPKHDNYICESCNGKIVKLEKLRNVKKQLLEIWKNKPKPTLLFDQRPVTMDTSLRRVAYMLSKNDIYGKNIVFLGDDDLTSICLALAYKNVNITVLDADKRLIDYINKIAKRNRLNIKALEYNVMDGVEKKLIGKFDTLMTDPTPEKIPFTIFTNSAIDLLKQDGILYVSIYSTAMSKNMDLQRVITDMNLYITDMIPGFTEYQAIEELYRESDKKLFEEYNVKFDENSICFTETLFRLIKNKDTHKLEIEYTAHDMMGKATKRVLKDKKKEVADESKYLDEVRHNIEKNENKKIIDGK